MTEHIKIMPTGEAIIPKDVCEKLDWHPGTEVELDSDAGRVVLRSKQKPRPKITIQQFMAERPSFVGQPATLEEMNEAIERGRAERWAAKEARSR